MDHAGQRARADVWHGGHQLLGMGVAPVGVIERAGLKRPRLVGQDEADARVERVQVSGHGDGVVLVGPANDDIDKPAPVLRVHVRHRRREARVGRLEVQVVVRALARLPVELSAVGTPRGLVVVAFRIRCHDSGLLVRFGEAMRGAFREGGGLASGTIPKTAGNIIVFRAAPRSVPWVYGREGPGRRRFIRVRLWWEANHGSSIP